MGRVETSSQTTDIGIVVCGRPDSEKFKRSQGILAGVGKKIIGVNTEVTAESNFNHYTQYPEVVAALKTLQEVAWTESETTQLMGNRFEGELVLTASDIMLDVETSYGRWQTFNKPSKEWNDQQIYSHMAQVLVGSGTVQFRIRMGQAAYHPRSNRGVAAQGKTYFEAQQISEDDLKVYLYGINQAHELGADVNRYIHLYSDLASPWTLALDEGMGNRVLRTNLGCYWEHPLLQQQIVRVNNADKGDCEFEDEHQQMMARLLGTPLETPRLITILKQFSQTNSHGNATDLISQCTQDVGGFVQNSRWLIPGQLVG